MDSETLKALKASIKHWRKNVAARTPYDASIEADACALCQMYMVQNDSCHGCPVDAASEGRGCGGTPYTDALDAMELWKEQPDDRGAKAAWRKAAQAELDFLKGLLPDAT